MICIILALHQLTSKPHISGIPYPGYVYKLETPNAIECLPPQGKQVEIITHGRLIAGSCSVRHIIEDESKIFYIMGIILQY